MTLKKQIHELKTTIKDKNKEIDGVKKNYKYTRINELETDQETFVDELMRMRIILEEALKTQGTTSLPGTDERVKSEIIKMEETVQNVKKENKELGEIIKEKEKEVMSQLTLIKEKESRIEKLKVSSKESEY